MAMQVREATENDFGQIMCLYRQLQPRDPVLTDGRDRDTFLDILRGPNLHLFVLIFEGKVVSTCYLNVIPNITRSARPYAVIENVVTDETVRGRGFGKVLMKHTLQFAWTKGCYKAMLQTGSKLEATHAFYRTCGFLGDEKTGYVCRPAQNVAAADRQKRHAFAGAKVAPLFSGRGARTLGGRQALGLPQRDSRA
jgi:GNAT superfamily N-acetyltransferase